MSTTTLTDPLTSTGDAIAELLLEKAEMLVERAAYEEAHATFLAAVTLDSTPAARLALGAFLAERGRESEGLLHLEAAWEQAKQLGSPAWRAASCESLATLHRCCGHFEQAARFQQRAIGAAAEGFSLEVAPNPSPFSTSGEVPLSLLLGRAQDALVQGEVRFANELLSCVASSSSRSSSQACEQLPSSTLGCALAEIETLDSSIALPGPQPGSLCHATTSSGNVADRSAIRTPTGKPCQVTMSVSSGEVTLTRAVMARLQGDDDLSLAQLIKAQREFRQELDFCGAAVALMHAGFLFREHQFWAKAANCYDQAAGFFAHLDRPLDVREARSFAQEARRLDAFSYGDPNLN